MANVEYVFLDCPVYEKAERPHASWRTVRRLRPAPSRAKTGTQDAHPTDSHCRIVLTPFTHFSTSPTWVSASHNLSMLPRTYRTASWLCYMRTEYKLRGEKKKEKAIQII